MDYVIGMDRSFKAEIVSRNASCLRQEAADGFRPASPAYFRDDSTASRSCKRHLRAAATGLIIAAAARDGGYGYTGFGRCLRRVSRGEDAQCAMGVVR